MRESKGSGGSPPAPAPPPPMIHEGGCGSTTAPRAPELGAEYLTILAPSTLDREVVDQRRQARSAEHMLSHFPNNPWCPVCQKKRANARMSQRSARGGNRSLDTE